MNRPFVTTAALVLTLLAGPATQAAEPAAMSETARMNYALGYQLGRDLAGTDFQSDALLAGIADGQKGAPPRLRLMMSALCAGNAPEPLDNPAAYRTA